MIHILPVIQDSMEAEEEEAMVEVMEEHLQGKTVLQMEAALEIMEAALFSFMLEEIC